MRIQVQMTELGHHIIALIKDVGELSGQMKSIEKRLDDKDKMVDSLVALRIKEELQKLHAEGRDTKTEMNHDLAAPRRRRTLRIPNSVPEIHTDS